MPTLGRQVASYAKAARLERFRTVAPAVSMKSVILSLSWGNGAHAGSGKRIGGVLTPGDVSWGRGAHVEIDHRVHVCARASSWEVSKKVVMWT